MKDAVMAADVQKSEIIQCVEAQLAEVEDAIRSHPAPLQDLYNQTKQAFCDEQASIRVPDGLAQRGMSSEQFKLVQRYLFTTAFMTAWFHLRRRIRQRDAVAQAACILAHGIGVNAVDAMKQLLTYEMAWRVSMKKAGLAAGSAFRWSLLLVVVLAAFLWWLLH